MELDIILIKIVVIINIIEKNSSIPSTRKYRVEELLDEIIYKKVQKAKSKIDLGINEFISAKVPKNKRELRSLFREMQIRRESLFPKIKAISEPDNFIVDMIFEDINKNEGLLNFSVKLHHLIERKKDILKYLDYIICWSIDYKRIDSLINRGNKKYLIYEDKEIEIFELSSLLNISI